MIDSLWNTKCPKCNCDAYVGAGFNKIECSNKACENYKSIGNKDDETKIMKREDFKDTPLYDDYMYGGGS